MSRPLFPFMLLGSPRVTETVGDTLPELQPNAPEPVLIAPAAKDFRPIANPQDRQRPAIGAKGAANNEAPKASSATGDATYSQDDSTVSPADPSETSASAVKEAMQTQTEMADEPQLDPETGDEMHPASESTQEAQTSQTSSFLLP